MYILKSILYIHKYASRQVSPEVRLVWQETDRPRNRSCRCERNVMYRALLSTLIENAIIRCIYMHVYDCTMERSFAFCSVQQPQNVTHCVSSTLISKLYIIQYVEIYVNTDVLDIPALRKISYNAAAQLKGREKLFPMAFLTPSTSPFVR